jgi:hypothetical protein
MKEHLTDLSARRGRLAMRLPRVVQVLCAVAVLGALSAAGAYGDRVILGSLILNVEGSVTPNVLPRSTFAPVGLQGNLGISTKDSSVPPPLRSAVVEFDRDGHLETRGLPVCPPGRIEQTSPAVARRKCKGAIVATGTVGAVIAYPGIPAYSGTSPLTVFNGPPLHGEATAVVHAQVPTFPVPTTYVVLVPIERIAKGSFGYRLSGEVPPIAEGHGSLIRASVTIHRLYKHMGRTVSYTSARCGHGSLEARGSLSFADGTVISGTIAVPCTVRR